MASFLALILCASAVALISSNGSVSLADPVFSDVPSGLYFSEGVEWLADEDITTGTSAALSRATSAPLAEVKA